ncbi:MarR family transcriptional regulator [Actinoalloteichus sp. AHMU CJ021]|uniref:MarR family protein n=1 Tax=Actinoalloteichus caeruleus DSM 43889 TaxID=1120930 RepID=A0ABT1JHI2_ACTCY|nr:MarR family transcriptional regulator [Actinoalloteichus caeruleus]AUS77986.1 MarR family transcriptional regulator [Actinoalloteichus sp. AHMU CJ021]MCP2331965.1 MarR family protein [Actinoalloteichus caeruleus DSM 43889]
MDEEIARLYAEHGLAGVRPRFAYPLIRLAHQGPMTIRDLARSLGRTHSAVSQTVTALRGEGLVTTEPGPDARTRVIHLTDRARDLLPFLEAEWNATEDACAELDAELASGLAEYVAAMRARLTERGFHARLLDHLDWRSEAGETSRTDGDGVGR